MARLVRTQKAPVELAIGDRVIRDGDTLYPLIGTVFPGHDGTEARWGAITGTRFSAEAPNPGMVAVEWKPGGYSSWEYIEDLSKVLE